MDCSYSNTKPHQKGKSLSKDDRITIQVMHSIGCSNRATARELNCSPSTIVYDQKRHCIPLYRQCETIQSCPRTNAIDANAAVRACSFIEAGSSTMFPTASISEAGLLMPALAML